MFIIEVAQRNPTAALALLLNLTTLFSCLRLYRKQHSKIDGQMIGFIGLVAMSDGLRLLHNAGFWELPAHSFNGVVDGAVAALYLLGLFILKLSSADHHTTRLRLRVSEANEGRIPLAEQPSLFQKRSAHAVFGTDSAGAIYLWHNSAVELFGWTREDVVGGRHPFAGQAVPQAAASGASQMMPMITKTGQRLDVFICLMPVPEEAKTLVVVLDYKPAESRATTVSITRKPSRTPSMYLPAEADVAIGS